MKLIAPSVLALVATTAAISTQLVKNYCNEEVFLTLAVNATEDATGPFPVPSGQAFTSEIIGQGNTAIITKNNDTFNSATPKMIMGSSTDLGVLYWSLSSQDGDPFVGEHFNVTTVGNDATGATVPGICQSVTTYDGQVHACQDLEVTLNVILCPFNAAP